MPEPAPSALLDLGAVFLLGWRRRRCAARERWHHRCMLALDLLGPVVLRDDGVALPLAIKKTQALLVLLAQAGSMPRNRVVALLWPLLDESTGRRNLRRELARLREAGAGEAVQADADFLALALAVTSDARAFEAALAEGRPDDALALWRGPPADGLGLDDAGAFDDWLAAETERLRALRRQALEASAASHEAGGDLGTALQRIEALLADDPLQEQRHRDAIRLLTACGRREAALAQYERCRMLLAAELGLQPMAATEALAAALRDGAEAPAAPAAAAAAATSPPATQATARLPERLPLVGREAEVAALEAAWAGAGPLLVEGEGGVGKTRLATDFCAVRGPFALARCRPGDRGVPYAAFTRALRVLAGDALAASGLPDWVNHELARVLPELGALPRPIESAEERARFFEACAQAWSRLADGSFDAVVIDDCQHADEPSQALLAFISQRADAGAARLLLLMRPGGAAAFAEGAALHLVLAPLTAEPVMDLVRQLSGVAAPKRFANRLQRATGGNPFFIAETLRHLAETGALRADTRGRWSTPFDNDTEDYRELPLPATVRDAVLARVQRLPDAPRRLLEAASLAAEPFAPSLLAAACALSELEAVAAIELALHAALLREHERGGYGFSHDLAQQALEGDLSPQRRRLVHRRLALAAVATRADPALTAQHFEAAGEAQRAVAFRLAAGDEAQRLFAGAQALQHWQAGLADGPTPAQRALLVQRCAQAQIDLGDGPGAQARFDEIDALLAAGTLTDDERAEALTASADMRIGLGQNTPMLLRIDALLAGLADGRARAKALRARSHALHNLGRLDEARATAEEALVLVPDDALERATLLDMMQMIEYQRARPQDALLLAREAAALWAAHGDRRNVLRGRYRVGVLLMLVGEPEAGERELEFARSAAAEMHLVEQQRDAIINLIKVHADRGDAARMLALADEGWNLSPTFPRPRQRQILTQARLHAHSLLGNMGEAMTLAEQVLAEAERNAEPIALQYAALTVLDLFIYLGDFERARSLLRRLEGAGTSQLAYYGIKLALNRAFLELFAGDAVAARAALAQAGAAAAMQQPQDRAGHALREAEVLLLEGQPDAAIVLLEPWRGEMPNVELQAQFWIVRLRAGHALGSVAPADWAQARAALAGGTMPPLEALELRRALLLAAPGASEAEALGAEVGTAIDRMAQSLAGWPEHQRRFLALVRR